MEVLGIKTTFTSGVQFELKKNEQNVLFVCLSGAPLQPVLDALQVSELALQSTPQDVNKLARLLLLSQNLNSILSA